VEVIRIGKRSQGKIDLRRGLKVGKEPKWLAGGFTTRVVSREQAAISEAGRGGEWVAIS
jgi:hypothetical protein